MVDAANTPGNTQNNTTANQTKLFFGVSLELGGKVISLEPKNAIQDLKTKGIEVELPAGERVYLGTAGSSLNSIFNALGVDSVEQYIDENGNLNTLGILSTDNSPNDVGTLDFAYLNFEELDYWGIDFGLEYFVNNALSVFGNVSWISQTLWEELNLVDSEISRPLSLNLPGTRFKAGVSYTPATGFFGNISARMTTDWESVNGLSFSGPVDGFTIIDAGAGYRFNSKLQVSVNATNLLDTKYRAIFGAPDIRRMVLGRIIYDIE